MLGQLLVAAAMASLASFFGSGVRAQSITSDMTDVRKLEGESLLLICTISGSISTNDRVWTAPQAEALLEDLKHERMTVTYNNVSSKLYLNVTRLTVADSGTYECQVPSKGLRHKITVVINKLPSSVSIAGGREISLTKDVDNNVTCTVTNVKPEAVVHWTSTGSGAVGVWLTSSSISPDNRLLFNTVSVLTVKPTEPGRINYTCKVTNPEFAGSSFESGSITAEVLHAPVISGMHSEPPATKYREHGAVKMTCVISTSNPSTVTWRWFQGGVLLPAVTTASHAIADIPSTLHGQQVTCEATNSIGSTNFSYPFIVEYGPRLKKPLESIEVDLGESQSFLCDIDSNPAPSIYWRKMATSDVVKTDRTLSFASIKDSDIGGYTCVASVDGFRDIVQADAYLLLKAAPKIAGDEDYFASHGEDAEVVCAAESIPKESTTFAWTKGRAGGSVPVDLSKKDKYVETVAATIHGKRSTLTVKSITSDDFVVYNCTVTNSKGRDTKAFRIQQRDDFPWQYAVIGVGSGLGLILAITLIVCLVKRRKSKSKSAADDSGSASVISQTTENSIRKPYGGSMHNDGAGYAAPGTWISNQFHNPDGYDHEGYPLRMDLGYDTMDSGERAPQPEVYKTFPARFDSYYGSYARVGQMQQQAAADAAAYAPLVPRHGQSGFYSTYAGSMHVPDHYGSSGYAPAEYFDAEQPPPHDAGAMADSYAAAAAGRPLHVDLPAATEASHLATNV